MRAVRDPGGRVVDFTYQDINPVAARQQQGSRDGLLGRSLAETLPAVVSSGLLDLYARCVDTGEPLTLDGFSYYGRTLPDATPNPATPQHRRYDIRGSRVPPDFISLTWRDVTDRSEAQGAADAVRDLMRVGSGMVPDPQVLLEVVRAGPGQEDELVIRDVNPAYCDYIGRPRSALVDHLQREYFPGVAASGLLARHLLCARTGQELLIEEFPYFNEVLGEQRYYEMRGRQVRPGLIILTFRDITGRVEAERRLAADLSSAARYVKSILPGDLTGPVRVSSRFMPSAYLGGDCYDYRWVDEDHLVLYLLDVSGHGVDAALMAVSVHNMLRSGQLSNPLDPGRVLEDLNAGFQMDTNDEHYLTIWYGVYRKSTRTLTYGSAGHPPAIALADGRANLLSTSAPPVGMFGDTAFTSAAYQVPRHTEILLSSDGAYEFPLPAGGQLSWGAFVDLCAETAASTPWSLDTLVQRLLGLSADGAFHDDCSLVLADFDGPGDTAAVTG